MNFKYKKKICKLCGKEEYIFSHNRCLKCSKKEYKAIKRTKLRTIKTTIQNKAILSQIKTFSIAFDEQDGKNYFTGELFNKYTIKAHNFMHVLPKKLFPYFKYYSKNIVLADLERHKLHDQGTHSLLIKKISNSKKETESWVAFIILIKKLKIEYTEWIKTNKGDYKI